MPRAQQHCSFPGCLKKISSNGRCSKHPHVRYTEAWSRNTDYGDRVPDPVKRTALRNANYTCQRCGGIGTDVDHIVPKHIGGLNGLNNLQVLCKICHGKKSSAEGHEALRVKRENIVT